ncbi:MAG: choice-of-anchor D domain-containing protein, partial [bacterium]
MKAPLTFFVCCLILFAGTGLASSQPIEVSIADTLSAAPGASVTIPILVGDLTGRDVLFYQTSIFFDETVLKATGASSVGTLSEPFGEPTVDISVEGQILVGGSDTTPLSGSGILVNLNFEVVGQPGDSTVLDFVGFIFNTGDPPAATTNGEFVVVPPDLPDIAVVPTSHDFGEVFVGASAVQDFVIHNQGTAALLVKAVNLSGVNAELFNIKIENPPFTLAPGDSQNFMVSFQPTSEGPKSATLEILSNDPDQDTVRVALSGTGLPAPVPDIAVRPTSHDFGAVIVDASAAQSFVVSNQGTADLVVSGTNLVGANPEQFSLDSLRVPFTLTPGDSQNLV